MEIEGIDLSIVSTELLSLQKTNALMALIKSISGIRGTIGGAPGEALTPVDIVSFTCAYVERMRIRRPKTRHKVVVGRDARISGEMVRQLVCGTLMACGVDVVDIGLASTPTTEMAVTFEGADGGIILTASHNPREWNALKLLDERGEFLDAQEGAALLEVAARGGFSFAPVDALGTLTEHDYTDAHIDAVLALEAVDTEAVRKAGFTVVLDAINSVGGIIMPRLLERLGVRCIVLNGEATGDFAHNPEPLPAHLTALSDRVVREKADLGISVDPDVDRLAFICENGEPFVEENTLVSVAAYLFEEVCRKADALGISREEAAAPYRLVSCSNLSSSRALRDVTEQFGGTYKASAVGEVNVTALMHREKALIGGEGNGGVIYPALHYGRDAMVGVALFLSNLAHKKITVSELKNTYPQYAIAKKKIELPDRSLVGVVFDRLKTYFPDGTVDETDGVKITFEAARKWVHLRPSNTEPIVRIYAEAPDAAAAEALAGEVVSMARTLLP